MKANKHWSVFQHLMQLLSASNYFYNFWCEYTLITETKPKNKVNFFQQIGIDANSRKIKNQVVQSYCSIFREGEIIDRTYKWFSIENLSEELRPLLSCMILQFVLSYNNYFMIKIHYTYAGSVILQKSSSKL